MGLDARKPVWGGGGVANNKGIDQPACPCSLISPFAFWIVLYPKLLKAKFQLSFKLMSVAVQAGLNLTLKETQKIGFLAARPI